MRINNKLILCLMVLVLLLVGGLNYEYLWFKIRTEPFLRNELKYGDTLDLVVAEKDIFLEDPAEFDDSSYLKVESMILPVALFTEEYSEPSDVSFESYSYQSDDFKVILKIFPEEEEYAYMRSNTERVRALTSTTSRDIKQTESNAENRASIERLVDKCRIIYTPNASTSVLYAVDDQYLLVTPHSHRSSRPGAAATYKNGEMKRAVRFFFIAEDQKCSDAEIMDYVASFFYRELTRGRGVSTGVKPLR